MVQKAKSSSPDDVAEGRDPRAETELQRRMGRPQRHRLLQGYPMAPLMSPASSHDVPAPARSTRPLIVGVLPHPFCNPMVKGCGFCTFPHQKYRRTTSARVVESVRREIRRSVARLPWMADLEVPAVYIGGGTANLVEPDVMATLYGDLASTFDLRSSELSLEGAPRYFSTRDFAHLDLLAGLDVEHRRISMGVQTFDLDWLEKMGRMAIGAPRHVETAVEAARERGITTSCDILFNLPGQSRSAMFRDVERAAGLGFDQICVYHLVLFDGLGTAWSRDTELVGAMAPMEEAADNWLALRQRLLELGYEQSTLTNFERADLPGSRRFRYERMSFQPEAVDGVGFGPGALTTFASDEEPWKTMNETDALAYVALVERRGDAVARAFRYTYRDDQLLHLTRQIPRTEMRRDSFAARFGQDPVDAFAGEFEALRREDLVTMEARRIRLTPRGMFFADSVAGLLAWRRASVVRANPGLNRAEYHHMG
jgi:oxygen-independent coproporphyrinogen-3 oxidase